MGEQEESDPESIEEEKMVDNTSDHTTPPTKAQKKAAKKLKQLEKAAEIVSRYVPDDDAVDYGATPLDDESDKESDVETEVKHDAKEQARRDEALALAEKQRLADESAALEATAAKQRLADELAEREIAAAKRVNDKEARRIKAEAQRLADAEDRQREIAENTIKTQEAELAKQAKAIDDLLKKREAIEDKLAKAKALALEKIASKAKVQEETRKKLALLATPASPVRLQSAPQVPSQVPSPTTPKVTTGPLRSLTVLPLLKQLPNGTTTEVWFKDMSDFTVDNVTAYDRAKAAWYTVNPGIESTLAIRSHFSEVVMDRLNDTVYSTAKFKAVKDDDIYIWDRADLREQISDYLQVMLPKGVPIATRANNAYISFKKAVLEKNPLAYRPGEPRQADVLTDMARNALQHENLVGKEGRDMLKGQWGKQVTQDLLRQTKRLGEGTTDDAFLMKQLYEEYLAKLLNNPTATLFDVQIEMAPFYERYEASYMMQANLRGPGSRRKSGIHSMATEAQDVEMQTDHSAGMPDQDPDSELNYVRGGQSQAPNDQRGGQGPFKPIPQIIKKPFGNAKQRYLDQRAPSPNAQRQGDQRPPTPPNRWNQQRGAQRPQTPPNTNWTPYAPQPGSKANTYNYGRNSPIEKKQRIVYDFCRYCGLTSHEWTCCQHKIANHPGINLDGVDWLMSEAAKNHLRCKQYHVVRGYTPQPINGVWQMVPI